MFHAPKTRLPALVTRPLPPGLLWGALVLALVLALFYLARFVAAQRREHRIRLRRERGDAGERQAVGLLEEQGYDVVAQQHEGHFRVLVDGELRSFRLRADLLVRRRRDGRLWLAEVKTGAVAPFLHHGPTRRQLLEYAIAYRHEVCGVLLVAPEHQQVRAVSFPELKRLRPRRWLPSPAWFLMGAALGAAVARLWRFS